MLCRSSLIWLLMGSAASDMTFIDESRVFLSETALTRKLFLQGLGQNVQLDASAEALG